MPAGMFSIPPGGSAEAVPDDAPFAAVVADAEGTVLSLAMSGSW